MAQYTTAEEYIKQLEFKRKRVGGCDEEDVLLKMKELSGLFLVQVQSLQEQLAQSNQRAEELEEQLAQSQQRGGELEEQLAKTIRESEVARGELARQRQHNREAAAQEETYGDKIQQLDNLLRTVEASKQDILQRAKADALQEAEQLRLESQTLRRQNGALADELKGSGLLLVSELEEIQKVIAALRGKVGTLSGIHVPNAN